MTHRAHDITAFVSGVFQFAQGLSRSVSPAPVSRSDITLFGTFQSVANESRRLYFVLSSLGFASAIETYMRESEQRAMATICAAKGPHTCARLPVPDHSAGLVMMPTDTLIAISPADNAGELIRVEHL